MKVMITGHFIKMLALFTLILIIGFSVIAYADREERQANQATILESLKSRFID